MARLELTLMRYDLALYEEYLRENPATVESHPAGQGATSPQSRRISGGEYFRENPATVESHPAGQGAISPQSRRISRTATVTLPSGRVVDQETYRRFTEPLTFTKVAGPRKAALIELLDRERLPWTWETGEDELEARLKRHSRGLHAEFVRTHPQD